MRELLVVKKRLKSSSLVLALALVTPLVLSGCAAAVVAGAGATSAAVSQDSRSFSGILYDEEIEQNSYKILKTNTSLTRKEDFRITITSYNGNVLVTGQTINRDYLKWCVKKIEQLEHVRKVYNYATLQSPVPPSVVSSDAFITSKVKSQLLLGKGIKSNRFKVVTENGHVFLMGIVTRDESTRAINTVLGISGVRKVYPIFDYIEISETKGNDAQNDDKYKVTIEKGSASSYQNPRSMNRPNSSYVPPASSEQNGGAYIVEDTSDSLY